MTRDTDDLARLLSLVAATDLQAFKALYGATSAKLYGIVLRILRRRDLADEVMQDVFVTIWQRARDFDAARASPITWMAVIARNRALDVVRRSEPVSIEDNPAAYDVADPQRLASETIELSDELRRLTACLDQLDPDKRAIVRHAYLDGWSREELSHRFGAPVATIKTWLHRSLKQIKDCLGA